jgi:hypothetical protein
VRTVELPAAPDATLETRSLVACLAAILDEPAEVLPCSADDPRRRITEALATRGLALVPVRDPDRFQWGGWWLARFAAEGPFVVMAGTPSAVVFAPAGTGASADAPIIEGFVPTRPALALPRDEARTAGVVEALFRSVAADAPMERLDRATVGIAGIDGDRYATGVGHFSPGGATGRALTLIEGEALDRLAAVDGVALEPGAHRRSVVTRGIDLNGLVGRHATIGAVRIYVQRLAEPCAWLQRTTPAGTLRGLVHRGGVRADVVVPGEIRVGDAVVAASGVRRGRNGA